MKRNTWTSSSPTDGHELFDRQLRFSVQANWQDESIELDWCVQPIQDDVVVHRRWSIIRVRNASHDFADLRVRIAFVRSHVVVTQQCPFYRTSENNIIGKFPVNRLSTVHHGRRIWKKKFPRNKKMSESSKRPKVTVVLKKCISSFPRCLPELYHNTCTWVCFYLISCFAVRYSLRISLL